MAKFLLVSWDASGGLLPMLGVASRLSERGHDVRLLGNPSIDERCGSHGWRFRPFKYTPNYDGRNETDLSTELEVLSQQQWLNPAVGRDLLAELQRESADVLVVDCMLLAGLSAAIASGLPTATMFHQTYSMVSFVAGLMTEPFNAARTVEGLEPIQNAADLYGQCRACLVAIPQAFEDDIPLPMNVQWVGPILDGPPLTKEVDRPPDVEADSIVLVSLGTSYQAQLPLLQRVIDAVSDFPVRAIVTTGPALDPAKLQLPPNVTALTYVPHEILLPHAALVITHAGLGTMMASLRHGLPMLCLPLGRDQFANAERAKALGVGRALPAHTDGKSISAAIEALLAPYATERACAQRLAKIFEGYEGANAAVRTLESLLPETSA